MAVNDLARANTGLWNRLIRIAASAVIEFVGRPNLDIFNQRRNIYPGITLRIKLMPLKT